MNDPNLVGGDTPFGVFILFAVSKATQATLWLRDVLALLGVMILFWAFLHWNWFSAFLREYQEPTLSQSGRNSSTETISQGPRFDWTLRILQDPKSSD